MLVLIERCQNTQCIAACCVWGCETADRSDCQCCPRSSAESGHTAKIVQEWFEEHNDEFSVLIWPPDSSDLNPIEHLWDVLDKQVPSIEAPPHNLQGLKDAANILEHTSRGVVESMPLRVKAVLAEKGGPPTAVPNLLDNTDQTDTVSGRPEDECTLLTHA